MESLYMKLTVRLHQDAGVTYWHILSYFFLIPLCLLVSFAWTITNTLSACILIFHVGRINLRMCGGALTSHCSGLSGFSMPLPHSISDSTSAAQSAVLSVGIYMLPFMFSYIPVSELVSGGLSSSHSTGWQSIILIRWTFNIWVCPPEWSLQTNLVGKVIFLTIWMQPCHHVERLTRMLWRSVAYLKCILLQASPLFWVQVSSCVAHRY